MYLNCLLTAFVLQSVFCCSFLVPIATPLPRTVRQTSQAANAIHSINECGNCVKELVRQVQRSLGSITGVMHKKTQNASRWYRKNHEEWHFSQGYCSQSWFWWTQELGHLAPMYLLVPVHCHGSQVFNHSQWRALSWALIKHCLAVSKSYLILFLASCLFYSFGRCF